MKLLLCEYCYDVFSLDLTLKSCKCGRVKGRYLTDIKAEVTPTAISIALGNGSLQKAISAMKKAERAKPDMSREDFTEGPTRIEYAWVRPNSGAGNPHTRVNKDL